MPVGSLKSNRRGRTSLDVHPRQFFLSGRCDGTKERNVFNGLSNRRLSEDDLEVSLQFAEDLVGTLRGPSVILSGDLRLKMATPSFCESFHVSKDEAEGSFIYGMNSGEWDIPLLHTLLEAVLRDSDPVCDFRVEHNFREIGHRVMLFKRAEIPCRLE